MVKWIFKVLQYAVDTSFAGIGTISAVIYEYVIIIIKKNRSQLIVSFGIFIYNIKRVLFNWS